MLEPTLAEILAAFSIGLMVGIAASSVYTLRRRIELDARIIQLQAEIKLLYSYLQEDE